MQRYTEIGGPPFQSGHSRSGCSSGTRLTPRATLDSEQTHGRASPIRKKTTRQRLHQAGSDSSSVTVGVVDFNLGLYDITQLEGL